MGSMAGKRILLVSPNHDVSDPTTGTGTRLASLGAGLAARGNEVVVLVAERYAGPRPPWASELFGFRQTGTPYLTDLNPAFAAGFVRALRSRGFDVVHVAQPKGLCVARAALSLSDSGALLTYASQLFLRERAHGNESVPRYKRAAGRYFLPGIERAAVAAADLVTTVSEADRRKYVRAFDLTPERTCTVPTAAPEVGGADLESRERVRERHGLPAGPVAVFHGNHDHPPNAEAAARIATELAPALPDVSFALVGNGTPEFDAPNVHTLGFVEDLFSTLNAADLAVVPITEGGGTKTKVFDYMALGLPTVLTPRAARGIDAADGHEVLVRAAGEPFRAATARLAEDPERQARIGANFRALARERYTWERSAATLDGFYERALGGTAAVESETDEPAPQREVVN
jgi:glycosyltransferase involved in cell wall biosynthesis